MIVTTLAPPAAEPVTLEEAKAYLRIAGDGDDGLVESLIAAARARIEQTAGVAMISRRLRVGLDRWPDDFADRRIFRLPVRPAADLAAVRIYAADGTSSDVTSRFDLARGRAARLVWTIGEFPSGGRPWRGIEIDYDAGFGLTPQDVADGLKLAVKRLAAHAFHARDAGLIDAPLPVDVGALIAPWRRVQL